MGCVRILCKNESGSGFYKCSPGPDFIGIVRVRTVSIKVWVSVRMLCGPAPDFINFSVRVRILSRRSGSVSGFYSIRVRVRILSSMSGSGFYKYPLIPESVRDIASFQTEAFWRLLYWAIIPETINGLHRRLDGTVFNGPSLCSVTDGRHLLSK